MNTIRINAALGSLLAAILLVSPTQGQQKAKPEPPTNIRKVNAALQAFGNQSC